MALAGGYPTCKDGNDNLDISNSKVLTWREHMEAKFQARALIKGTIVGVIEARQNHVHFEVDLDNDLSTSDDRLEVIYNIKFGDVPDNRPGDTLVACGDFIVDPYSPMKAVLHWVHKNPKGKGHEDGFLWINGNLTGQVSGK
ncbi:MAG: hypothetical protein J7501_10135 [Bdellovibrio sp.]|nr:hypothetical protein [Bdellovibrio sp.]